MRDVKLNQFSYGLIRITGKLMQFFGFIGKIFAKTIENNFLLYFAVLVLVFKIIAIIAFIAFPQNIFFADITKIALTNFVNQTRESSGLNRLAESSELGKAARLKAENMVQNRYFSHISPDGMTPWHWISEAGYDYKYAGENLAVGFYDSKEVYNAWLASPSHRQNLLNPNYTEIGTAVLGGFGDGNAVVVVQLFAAPSIHSAEKNSSAINNFSGSISQSPEEARAADGTNSSDGPDYAFLRQEPAPVILGVEKSSAKRDALSEVLNFILYGYDGLTEEIIYGISLVMAGVLVFVSLFNGQLVEKNLILKSVIILILFYAAALLDKEAVALIIPHKLII